MANVLILGGGFGGVVAAERLAQQLSAEHHITLVSRSHNFVFYTDHEMRLVIDDSGSDSIYLHKDIWTDEPATVRQGRFWSWAKRAQQRYWEISHS